MSLLLDALKKAAEDKKKLSDDISASTDGEGGAHNRAESVEELSLQEVDAKAAYDSQDTHASATTVEGSNSITEAPDEELTLEAVPTDAEIFATAEKANPVVNKTRHTVSDEALSLLIYKTNSEEKKRKRIITFGAITASLLVLFLGGNYYYYNFQEKTKTLEFRHQASMRMMESKTNQQQPPEKTEIISNLTANNNIKIEKKSPVVAVKQNNKLTSVNRTGSVKQNKPRAKVNNKALIIEKSKQGDVITEHLEAAWSAYDNTEYVKAKTLYQIVVAAEKNNRDALLGLGAIAVIEKNNSVAKQIYGQLLRLDPNDPIAASALSGLHSEETSPKLNEKYLVSILEKAPDAAQINFQLGNVYAQQNKWPSAQQFYFKAWQQDSENADYIYNLAVSLDQIGKQVQASDFYKDSLLKAKNKQVSFSTAAVKKRLSELSDL